MMGNMNSPLAQLNTPKPDRMSVPLLVCKYTVPIATEQYEYLHPCMGTMTTLPSNNPYTVNITGRYNDKARVSLLAERMSHDKYRVKNDAFELSLQ